MEQTTFAAPAQTTLAALLAVLAVRAHVRPLPHAKPLHTPAA